jgi:hypothetical protein
MRNYAKIAPQFWIGNTGRKLRDAGSEALLVALYLLSSPHANMLGLYYLPRPFIAHETGLGIVQKYVHITVQHKRAAMARYDEILNALRLTVSTIQQIRG